MTIKLKDTMIKIILYVLIIATVLNLYGIYSSSNNIKKIATICLILDLICCISYVFLYPKDIIRTTRKRKTTLLLIGLVLYELIISAMTNSFFSYNTVLDICLWPLLFVVFYSYSYDRESNHIFKGIIAISIVVIMSLCFLLAYNRFYGFDELGTGAYYAYYCLTFLPLFLSIKANKKGNVILILLSNIIILFTSKRAGIIVAVMSLATYLVVDAYIAKNLKSKLKRYIVTIIVALVAITAMQYVLNKYNINILKRFESITTDGGSGRTDIWNIVINAFKESSTSEKVFGHGYQSVYYRLMPKGRYSLAHNSFIEYLYDYGIIGLSLLILLVITILKYTMSMLKQRKTESIYMSMSVIIMLVFSCLSYFFEVSLIILPLALYWGVCMGKNEREKLILLNKKE